VTKYKAFETHDIEVVPMAADETLSLDRTLSELKQTYLNLSLSEKSELTDAFVEAIVDTIDMRDTTTSGHSKRIAKYSLEMMRQLNKDNDKYTTIDFTDNEMKEMYYAALLHDIGKLAIKESILLKHQRLSADRIESLKHKFVYLKSCLKIKLENGGLLDHEVDILANLDKSLEFVNSVNKKQHIDDYTVQKLMALNKAEVIDCSGTNIRVLDDYEFEHLSVRRGNLVSSEWADMKEHAKKTKDFLETIPWLKSIKNVPKIASSHHEKLDGSGYPKGLSGDEITLQMRILSIVDIFEALTASDRPYK
jgi:HD-GYP domain-containing protein (c-di-GMP phosphodiesterase class II)